MTGELFEVLRTHSVLRHSLAGPLHGPQSRCRLRGRPLAAGIDSPQRLSATLFKVRATSLRCRAHTGLVRGFLSGLLIGSEIGAQREWIGAGEVAIVGDAGLADPLCQRPADRSAARPASSTASKQPLPASRPRAGNARTSA